MARLGVFAAGRGVGCHRCTGGGSEDDEDEDDDDGDGGNARRREPVLVLAAPEIDLEVLPLVTENPRICFERYVQRLPEQLAATTDTVWDKLQARAGEQILGGHVGKLECFWILRPGTDATPEAAEGLVCF